jgi:ubiquinone/menaquinone biosynthesis C-methylase UbiE
MSERVCPWWLGYLLISPLRRIWYNPENVLKPYIHPGMMVLEVGSGMGFFTLPLARLVGESGQVVCVDLQEKMIRALKKRVTRAGLRDRIELRVNTPTSLCIDDLVAKFDFALVFAVAHEVLDARQFFVEIRNSLRRGASLLFSEPAGHVSKQTFESSLETALSLGFRIKDSPKIRGNHTSLWVKD